MGTAEDAPMVSADGQVILVSENRNFPKEEFYTLQALTQVPNSPMWVTVVGHAYRLSKSDGAPALNDPDNPVFINFQYLGKEVPAGEERFLHVYFLPDSADNSTAWQLLDSTPDSEFNSIATRPFRAKGFTRSCQALRSHWSAGAGTTLPTVFNIHRQLKVRWHRSTTTTMSSGAMNHCVRSGRSMPPMCPHGSVICLHSSLAVAIGSISPRRHGITLYLNGGNINAVNAAAAPNLPAIYYGELLRSATFTPTVGMTVTAKINGADCRPAETQTTEPEVGKFVYVVKVEDCGSANPPSEL